LFFLNGLWALLRLCVQLNKVRRVNVGHASEGQQLQSSVTQVALVF
jgi:hypothetical protein